MARTDFNPGNISVKDVLNAHRRELEKARISCRRKKRGPTLAAPAISYFRADELENVAAEHPGVSAEEVLQILEQKWKKMDKTARRPYLQLAARDQARYAEEKRNYIPKSAGGNMKKPKKKKHPDAPKHPRCAYLFFVAENRELLKKKNPQLTFTEIAKMLGEMWKNMTPEEKSRFEIMAEEDKEKYRKAKDKFPEPVTIVTPDPDPFGYSDKAEVPSAPKHPASAYLFFVASNRQRLQEVFPDKSFTDTARILGILWRQLSREDRRKFELLAAADKRRYEEEKLAWEPPADTFSSFTRSFGNVTQTIEAEKEKKFNSAYAIWASAERAAVLQDHPDMDRKELTKLLKETWKSLAYHEKLVRNPICCFLSCPSLSLRKQKLFQGNPERRPNLFLHLLLCSRPLKPKRKRKKKRLKKSTRRMSWIRWTLIVLPRFRFCRHPLLQKKNLPCFPLRVHSCFQTFRFSRMFEKTCLLHCLSTCLPCLRLPMETCMIGILMTLVGSSHRLAWHISRSSLYKVVFGETILFV